MFAIDALAAQGFTWKTALSLALASRLSYQASATVVRVAREQWGLDSCTFVERGDTQCLVASSPQAVVVAFRGTESLADWLSDLTLHTRSRPYGTVHAGFCAAYLRVDADVRQQLEGLGGRMLLLTGHSLGGALALMAAAELWGDYPAHTLYTFGQPRVGRDDFVHFAEQHFGSRYYRFVNDDDIVARVPPRYRHAGQLYHFDASGQLRGLSKESPGGEQEPPALSDEEFRELQKTVRAVRAAAYATKASPVEAEAVATASVEGLIPGATDHKLERYIAHIRRLAMDSTEARVDRHLEVSQWMRATRAATEAVRSSYSGNHSEVGTPVLLRVRSADWQPPPGLAVQSRFGVFATARARDDQISELRRDPEVVSIEASRDAGVPECSMSMPFVRVPQVHAPLNGQAGELGDRAIVGIIDSGIDVLHRAFCDSSDPPATRILGVWNQRDPRGPSPRAVNPDAFTQDYGTYYGRAEIDRMVRGELAVPIALRDPDQDALGNPVPGHGTHVASIAAGRAAGEFAGGVAPEAKLLVVIPNMVTDPDSPPSLGYSNSHIDAIAFLHAAAVREGLPIAVNVSLGMNAGAHDGQSNLEAAFDALTENGTRRGLVIVKSAGNEGDAGGHAQIQAFPGANSLSWESRISDRPRDYIEVWYDEWQELEFCLVDPTGHRTTTVSRAAPSATAHLGGNFCTLTLQFPHPDNGHHLLQITIVRDSAFIQEGRWTLEAIGISVGGEHPMLHAWVERDRSRSVRFVTGDSSAMTLSIPGTAEHIITVSACGTANPIRVPAFSSQGRTRDGRPKPDLCAPGEMVTAAASNAPDPEAVVAMAGTSMAAPHVAGAVALALSLRQKSGRPQFNANQIRAVLKRTAVGANAIHHPAFGFGALDAAAFLTSVREMP